VIQPADIFPPASPKNVVAIAVPATGDTTAHFELSWNIGSEPDLAGYYVYRMEGSNPSDRGTRLTHELLLTPAFRDLTAAPGRRYTYCVTSVDRTGNESAPSDAVTVVLPPRDE
jgi:fibronectin type 3 domain-containing protein